MWVSQARVAPKLRVLVQRCLDRDQESERIGAHSETTCRRGTGWRCPLDTAGGIEAFVTPEQHIVRRLRSTALWRAVQRGRYGLQS